jgi:hypothetical protein
MARPALVRVRLADGTQINHTRAWAERHGLEVIDRPTVVKGRAARSKPKVSVAEAAESKQPTTITPDGSDTPASKQEESE